MEEEEDEEAQMEGDGTQGMMKLCMKMKRLQWHLAPHMSMRTILILSLAIWIPWQLGWKISQT